MIPPVVASDRGRAQTRDVATHPWGSRTALLYFDREENLLESRVTEGDNPVSEARRDIAVS